MYGRSYDNQRFSPLTQIKPANVKNLRPVWTAALNSLDGLEGNARRSRRRALCDPVPMRTYLLSTRSPAAACGTGRPRNRKDSERYCAAAP